MSENNAIFQSPEAESRSPVQSVERACAIVQWLALQEGGGTASELSRHLGVHRSTVSRLLAALAYSGMVERDELTGRYHLGLQILTMSGSILSRLEVLRIADPAVRRLAETTQETVNLGIRHGETIVNIEQVPGPNILRSLDWIGKTAPLHRGAGAKALLAHLSDQEFADYIVAARVIDPDLNAERLRNEVREIRAAGVAVNRGEIDPRVYAVGAPIFDSQGRCCASISVAGTQSELTDERVSDLARKVVATAAMVSRQLGYSAGRFSVIA